MWHLKMSDSKYCVGGCFSYLTILMQVNSSSKIQAQDFELIFTYLPWAELLQDFITQINRWMFYKQLEV